MCIWAKCIVIVDHKANSAWDTIRHDLRAYWESIWNLEKMLKYQTFKKSQQNNINFFLNFATTQKWMF
jgi:hypothetical protein